MLRCFSRTARIRSLGLAIALIAGLWAQSHAAEKYGTIRIVSGLDAGRVYQRRDQDAATLEITGLAHPSDAQLKYRVMRHNQTVEGFDWSPIILSPEGAWAMKAEALPTGGPFRFEFRLEDASSRRLDQRQVANVYVGDLYLLAGQSNMDGCGPLESPWVQEPITSVRYFSLADAWSVAEDPMHFCSEALYPVYLTSYNPSSPTGRSPIAYRKRGGWPNWQPQNGAGIGIPFGKRIYEQTGVPIGLVLCSLGGTTMQHWSPDLKELGAKSLYGAMLERVGKVGGRVSGLLWWQGESDYNSTHYEQNMKQLISAIRHDIGPADLPIMLVQLASQDIGQNNPASPIERVRVREIQRRLAEELPGVSVVASIDQKLSSGAHIDTEGYTRVGRRLAQVALNRIYDQTTIQLGPRLQSAQLDPDRRRVRIVFDQVNGTLHDEGEQVQGFSIRPLKGGNELVQITEARFDSGDLILHLDPAAPQDACLWYGYGWMPKCNVVDELDMALPAFGPVLLK